jgi:hypothetical protein
MLMMARRQAIDEVGKAGVVFGTMPTRTLPKISDISYTGRCLLVLLLSSWRGCGARGERRCRRGAGGGHRSTMYY